MAASDALTVALDRVRHWSELLCLALLDHGRLALAVAVAVGAAAVAAALLWLRRRRPARRARRRIGSRELRMLDSVDGSDFWAHTRLRQTTIEQH